jgi:hypothetical protein
MSTLFEEYLFISNDTPLKSDNSLNKLANLAKDNGEGSSSKDQGSLSNNEDNSSNNDTNVPFPKPLLRSFSKESLENIRNHMKDQLCSSTITEKEKITAQQQINVVNDELTERTIAELNNHEDSSSSEEDNTDPADNGEGSSTTPNTSQNTTRNSQPSGAATQGLRGATDETLRREVEELNEEAKNLVSGTKEHSDTLGKIGFREHILKERAKYNTQILSEDQIEGRPTPSKPSYTGKGKGVDRG